MAYKNPPEHTRFKPGKSGNPSGKKKRAFTAEDLAIEIEKCLLMTKAELAEVLKSGTATGIQSMAASACMRAAIDGDWSKINSMLDRCVGKVKDVVENHNIDADKKREKILSLPRDLLYDFVRDGEDTQKKNTN